MEAWLAWALSVTSEESNPRTAAPMVSFRWNWPLAASPGRGTARKRFVSTVGSSGLDSQVLATILDPFRVIFDDLGPDRLSET